jgi:uncharacterized membrane protein YvbJ
MFCEHCGAELEQDARFCSICGNQVGEDVTPLSREKSAPRLLTRRASVWKHSWLIVTLFGTIVLASALWWIMRPTQLNVMDFVSDPKALTRTKAAKLIEQNKEMRAFNHALELDRTAVKEGEMRGLWKYKQTNFTTRAGLATLNTIPFYD